MPALSWTTPILGLEAALLALHLAACSSSTSHAGAALGPTVLGLVLGFGLTAGALAVPRAQRARLRLYGLALRLHRCMLPSLFPPIDSFTASAAAPAAAKAFWLLVVRSGVSASGRPAAADFPVSLQPCLCEWLAQAMQ
jgi:hypothetical protein